MRGRMRSVSTSARRPADGAGRRPRSTPCWKNSPARDGRSCDSRAATRSSSGAAVKRRSPWPAPACRSRSCPASRRRWLLQPRPAYPVTHRGLSGSVTIVNGHDPDQHAWSALADGGGTLVFLMAVEHLEEIAAALLAHGRPADEPSAIVQWATTSRQRVVSAPLAEIAASARAAGMEPPGRSRGRPDRGARGRIGAAALARPHPRARLPPPDPRASLREKRGTPSPSGRGRG